MLACGEVKCRDGETGGNKTDAKYHGKSKQESKKTT